MNAAVHMRRMTVWQTVAILAFAACADSKPARPELPGSLYFVEDASTPQLVRVAGGTRTVIGRELYPSPSALPDGRVVAIASRGDGSAESEQLALIGPRDAHVDRIGPAAAQLRDPAVDPRGRWIVVAANLDGHSDLYRIELGGGGAATRITNDPEGNFAPAALGESIVYASSRDGDSEIYRDDTRLTAFYRDDWQPTPSPDGSTIAFLSDRDGTPHLYLMAADGTNLRRLTAHAGEESAPVWSRDGMQLAYVVDGHVWVRDMTSGRERDVTPNGAQDLEPSLSPDGRHVAVARVRGGASDIYVVNVETGESIAIAHNARLPRWF
jgi:TolB protein